MGVCVCGWISGDHITGRPWFQPRDLIGGWRPTGASQRGSERGPGLDSDRRLTACDGSVCLCAWPVTCRRWQKQACLVWKQRPEVHWTERASFVWGGCLGDQRYAVRLAWREKKTLYLRRRDHQTAAALCIASEDWGPGRGGSRTPVRSAFVPGLADFLSGGIPHRDLTADLWTRPSERSNPWRATRGQRQ